MASSSYAHEDNLIEPKQLKLNKIQDFLNSIWELLVLSFLIVVFWGLNFPYVSLTVMLAHQILVLIFCVNNPKALIFPVLSFTYAITSISGVFNWVFYLSFISIFIFSIIIYVILQNMRYHRTLKKGSLFWVFLLCLIGNCLAGIVGYFDILNFLVTFVLSFAVYGVYWFCLNFITDYKRYLAWCFVFLSLTIIGEMIVFYLRAPDISYAITQKTVRISTGEINTAAIFMLTGLCASFYLANRHKKDYLFLILAFFIVSAEYFTFSRIALVSAVLVSCVYSILTIKNSPNRKQISIAVGVVLLIAVLLSIIFFEKVKLLFDYYLKLGFSANGREPLWKWCFENFKNNFLFGIGFVTRNPEAISTLQGLGLSDLGGFSLVNCHNTILHFLTCTGVVGLVLNAPLYFKKYQMVFKNFSYFKLFCFMNYLCIALCGMLDSTPTMSIFGMVPILMLLAFCEKDVEVSAYKDIKSNSAYKIKNQIKNS